jgi:hypothetical protein
MSVGTGRRWSWVSQDLWIKDIAITTGLASTTTTRAMLPKLVAAGRRTPEKFVSHQVHGRQDPGRLEHPRSRDRESHDSEKASR